MRAEPRIVQNREELAVGGEHVAAVVGAADRGAAQFGVQRVGVGAVGVVEDLVVDAGRCHGDPSGALRAWELCQRPGWTNWARRSLGSWPVTTTVAWWMSAG